MNFWPEIRLSHVHKGPSETKASDDPVFLSVDLEDIYAGPTIGTTEDEVSGNYLAGVEEGLGKAALIGGQVPRYRGKATSRSMATMVQHLAEKRETGVLRVDLEDRMLVFIWLEGQPIYFASDPNEVGHSLDDALAELPSIDRRDFEIAQGLSQSLNRPVALMLVDMGILQLDEVGDVMRFMARKLANILHLRPDGRFLFWSCPESLIPWDKRLNIEAVLQWDPASLRSLPVASG